MYSIRIRLICSLLFFNSRQFVHWSWLLFCIVGFYSFKSALTHALLRLFTSTLDFHIEIFKTVLVVPYVSHRSTCFDGSKTLSLDDRNMQPRPALLLIWQKTEPKRIVLKQCLFAISSRRKLTARRPAKW